MGEAIVTYQLKHPIEVPARRRGTPPEVLSSVTVRRGTAADMRATDAAKGEVAKAIILLSKVTALDQAIIGKLDMADFEALSGILADFTAGTKSEG